jgi:hypothetical protein
MAGETKNEGEGSRTAARDYNERTRSFMEKEDVQAKAEEARAAVEGEEREELEHAENVGKGKARELEEERKRES